MVRSKITDRWFQKAGRELRYAKASLNLQEKFYEEIVFLCQQSAEKSIKGFLAHYKIQFPKTHDIGDLLKLVERVDKGEYVFGGEKPFDPSHFARLLKQDLRRIPELKPINFHGLRHTFCSFLDSTGMNRRIVSEIMGHRDLSTTDRYSHVSNQTLGFETTRWVQEQIQQNSNKVLLSVVN